MATITIQSPSAGASVNQSFTSNGAWDNVIPTSPSPSGPISSVALGDPPGPIGPSTLPTPLISVVLKNSSGITVATGITSVDPGGTWQSAFALTQTFTDLTLVASISGTTASDSHGGITVT